MRRGFFALLLAALTVAAGCSSDAPVSSPAEISEEYGEILPDFTGIAFDEEANPSPSINNKHSKLGMFAYDGETVYFTNRADGDRLYARGGGEVNCLTEIPAFSLHYRDGEIYFLSDRLGDLNNTDNKKGRLYKYVLASGETIPLSDTVMQELMIDETGVYYRAIVKKEDGSMTNALYRFDEESGESERLPNTGIYQRFGEIEIAFGADGTDRLSLLVKKGEEAARIPESSKVIPYRFCIYDGKFYYADQLDEFSFHSIDLANGEKEDFGYSVYDYTFVNGTFYYLAKNNLFCRAADQLTAREAEAEEELEWAKDYTADERSQAVNYYELYTTETALYALVEWYREGKGYSSEVVWVDPDEQIVRPLYSRKSTEKEGV